MGFDFDIQYRCGASNRLVDALSWDCSILTVPQWKYWDALWTELEEDEFLKKLRVDIDSGTQTHTGFIVEQGVLYYKSQLVIPKSSKLILSIIAEFHTSPMGSLSGEMKTYQCLVAELFWVGMHKDILKFVQDCTVYQRNKYLATT